MRIAPFLFSFLAPMLSALGQTDTLTVVSYNLTNYGNIVTGCTTANNGIAIKNPELKNILQYLRPDILGVCEMNTNPTIAGSFLNNVLNTNGITYYQRSAPVSEPSGTLTSVLYYNSQKMGIKNQGYANTSVRLVHHFRLYMKTPELANGDTLWLNILAGHLKAGNTTADRDARTAMATAVRNYLNTFSKKENCLIMGDFNLYNNGEGAWQNLTAANPNPTYQFIDPINRVGSWSANSSFANVHTQCPTVTSNGCFSGGGLDDRFDFILMNRHLLNDSAGIRFVPGSYRAVGNDGLHYNKNLLDSPTNTSAPTSVLQSLQKASDHLPVLARLRINGMVTKNQSLLSRRDVSWTVDKGHLWLHHLPLGETWQYQIFDALGRNVKTGELHPTDDLEAISTGELGTGIWWIRLQSEREMAYIKWAQ